MTSPNLPAIQDKSPLAEGATVNIRQRGDRWQLRVWLQGGPVEDSMHDNPSDALGQLARILMEKMGGQEKLISVLLRTLGQS